MKTVFIHKAEFQSVVINEYTGINVQACTFTHKAISVDAHLARCLATLSSDVSVCVHVLCCRPSLFLTDSSHPQLIVWLLLRTSAERGRGREKRRRWGSPENGLKTTKRNTLVKKKNTWPPVFMHSIYTLLLPSTVHSCEEIEPFPRTLCIFSLPSAKHFPSPHNCLPLNTYLQSSFSRSHLGLSPPPPLSLSPSPSLSCAPV